MCPDSTRILYFIYLYSILCPNCTLCINIPILSVCVPYIFSEGTLPPWVFFLTGIMLINKQKKNYWVSGPKRLYKISSTALQTICEMWHNHSIHILNVMAVSVFIEFLINLKLVKLNLYLVYSFYMRYNGKIRMTPDTQTPILGHLGHSGRLIEV